MKFEPSENPPGRNSTLILACNRKIVDDCEREIHQRIYHCLGGESQRSLNFEPSQITPHENVRIRI